MRIALVILALALCGCSALTLQQATESVSAKRETEEKSKTKVVETGSPPLVSKSTTISVDSEGPVTINPGRDPSGSDSQLITKEVLNALAEIRNSRNTDQSSTFKESVEVDLYKSMSYLGGLFLLVVAIACILMVRALKLLRLESTKWGFDPKTVGQSAHKMFKMLGNVEDMISRENSSLTNKLTNNGISEETAGQIQRQLLKLAEMKKVVEKVDMIQRVSCGG